MDQGLRPVQTTMILCGSSMGGATAFVVVQLIAARAELQRIANQSASGKASTEDKVAAYVVFPALWGAVGAVVGALLGMMVVQCLYVWRYHAVWRVVPHRLAEPPAHTIDGERHTSAA